MVELAEPMAVSAAVVGCYDRVLTGDRSVPPDLDRALAGARGLPGLPGRVGDRPRGPGGDGGDPRPS